MKHAVNIQKLHLIIINITVAFWVTVMFVFLPACSGNQKNMAKAIDKKDTLATMETMGVTTYISDSGLIRYKIVAEKWDIFDKKNPSYWAFERGAYLERFDTLFNIDASIKADTAYYFDRKKLWELRGNVHIQNLQGDKFDTQLLFWDEGKQKMYSDKYIHIERADQTQIEGMYGFESNQQLTDYIIYNNKGVFTVNNTGNQGTSPSAAPDSSQVVQDSVLQVRPSGLARPSTRKDYENQIRHQQDTIKVNSQPQSR